MNNDQVSLDQQCINTLRFLSVDMVQQANSEHPGHRLGQGDEREFLL